MKHQFLPGARGLELEPRVLVEVLVEPGNDENEELTCVISRHTWAKSLRTRPNGALTRVHGHILAGQ